MPLRLVLARSGELAVALVDVVAYSAGFALRLVIQIHHDAAEIDPRQVMFEIHGPRDAPRDDQFRFGVEFADGRKATNLGPRWPPPDDPPPISLRSHGGGGGGGQRFHLGYWVYPLPPAGPLTLAVSWLARGIPEQTHSLEAEPIIAAAAGSIVLWEDDRPIQARGPEPVPGAQPGAWRARAG